MIDFLTVVIFPYLVGSFNFAYLVSQINNTDISNEGSGNPGSANVLRTLGKKAAIFVLILLPWLDTSKVRSSIFRPIYRKFFWVLVITVILLGYLGAKPPEGIYLILARIATAYYFIHFLVLLPLLGRYEKTDPLPMSISDPVLNKPGLMDKFKKAAANYEGDNVGSFK